MTARPIHECNRPGREVHAARFMLTVNAARQYLFIRKRYGA